MSAALKKIVASVLPVAIIAALFWVALFVEPTSSATPVELPIVHHRDRFYGVSVAPGERQVWVVGSGGKILAAEQGEKGWEWKVQPSGTTSNLQGVAAWGAMRALAVGNGGLILRTDDGGQRWSPVDVDTSDIADKLIGVVTLPGGTAFVVGEYNGLFRSEDWGKSWRRVIDEEDVALYGVAFDGDHGIVVGEFGRILVSADRGFTWTLHEASDASNLTGVAWGPHGAAVAVGLEGRVLYSPDRGDRWISVDAGTRAHLYAIDYIGGRYLAVGTDNTLLESADGRHWEIAETGPDRGRAHWYTAVRALGDGLLLSGSMLAFVDTRGVHPITYSMLPKAP